MNGHGIQLVVLGVPVGGNAGMQVPGLSDGIQQEPANLPSQNPNPIVPSPTTDQSEDGHKQPLHSNTIRVVS